jgi:hypothetical protein
VLENPNAEDVILVHLPILEGSATSLILWRLTTVEGKVITSIYRMDFDIDNDEAKDRVIARSAEHALAKLDTATIANLLSNTPRSKCGAVGPLDRSAALSGKLLGLADKGDRTMRRGI